MTEMPLDQLRKLVEQEVRRALAGETVGEDSPAAETSPGRLLVLCTGSTVGAEALADELAKLKRYGYELTVVLCGMAIELLADRLGAIRQHANILEGESFDRAEALVRECDAVLIPILSRMAAAKLALGIADNFLLSLAMQAMLVGKPVVAARNAADPRLTDHPSVGTQGTPEPLRQLAGDYLARLESYGVRLLDISQLAEHFDPHATRSYVAEGGGKTLISQSVIANLSPQVRELVIPNPAIITPLARDLAREKGIVLRLDKR